MIMKRFIAIAILLILSTAAIAEEHLPTPAGKEVSLAVTLTATNQPGQTLEGFGCSMVDLRKSKIPDAARAEMFDRVFGGLHMNVLRLWTETDANRTAAQMKAGFYQTYVDSGMIAERRNEE